jgi:hypothetical protein
MYYPKEGLALLGFVPRYIQCNLKRKQTKKQTKKKRKEASRATQLCSIVLTGFPNRCCSSHLSVLSLVTEFLTPPWVVVVIVVGGGVLLCDLVSGFLTPLLAVVVPVLGVILPCGTVVGVSSLRGFQSPRWSASFFPALGWFDSPHRGVSNPSLDRRHHHRPSFFPMMGRYRRRGCSVLWQGRWRSWGG